MTSSTPLAANAIVLEKVSRIYGGSRLLRGRTQTAVTALDQVDLAIAGGEIFGLVGESGSGKTTIARLIVQLERPNHGTIRITGRNIRKLRGKALLAFRRQVQMIFQDPYQSLNPYHSIDDIVREPLEIHKHLTAAQRQNKVDQTLQMVGLDTIAGIGLYYPHQLSGGQRQRVAIARAMVLDPDILIADEPTSMLDASIAIQIYQILTAIQQARGVTMVFITHSLAAAHYLCDRIAVIYRGHIVETGPARAVIATPRHPYTQALLDALPKFGHELAARNYNTLHLPERTTEATGGCVFYSRCRLADEAICPRRRPPMVTLADRHSAACHLLSETRPQR